MPRAVGNTVFAGTNEALYRLNSDVWQQLPVGPLASVYSVYFVTGFENGLYIRTGTDFSFSEPLVLRKKDIDQIILRDDAKSNRFFHSTDLGVSWTEITLGNEHPFTNTTLGMLILTNTDNIGEMLFLQGTVVVDKNTFYSANWSGIHRTIDGGESWHPFMNGTAETNIQDLVALNNRLYGHTGRDLAQSADGGAAWETVHTASSNQTLEAIGEKLSHSVFLPSFTVSDC